jgi:hypothetical protein
MTVNFGNDGSTMKMTINSPDLTARVLKMKEKLVPEFGKFSCCFWWAKGGTKGSRFGKTPPLREAGWVFFLC